MIRKLVRVTAAVTGLFLLCFLPAKYLVPSHPYLAALGFFAVYVALCWVALYVKDAITR